MEKIPEKYILERWCKNSRRVRELEVYLAEQCASFNERKAVLRDMWIEINKCVSLVQYEHADSLAFVKHLQSFSESVESNRTPSEGDISSSKIQEIEMLIDSTAPAEVTVKQPKISKNKGTGVHLKNASKDKRLKSNKEKAIEKSHKSKRLCRGCNQLSHHDIRNCPYKHTDQ